MQQSRLFVFAGISDDMAAQHLSLLLADLNTVFSAREMLVKFTLKDKLLTARFDDVSFYVSIFSDEKEVDDFYEMAENFLLTTNPNPVDNVAFEARLALKRVAHPRLYNDAQYQVAGLIFGEIRKVGIKSIYFFL